MNGKSWSHSLVEHWITHATLCRPVDQGLENLMENYHDNLL